MSGLRPFRLERFFARYEFSAPYLMCSSDCESLALEELLAFESGAQAEFNKLWLGYTESKGRLDLRTQIAALYEGISPDDVLVFAGAEEGIFVFMNVFLHAGDEVILHTPYYQSLGEIASSLGCKVIEWQGDAENGWALSMEWLKENLSPRTKLVILNCPHNPTGYLMPRDDFNELAALSRQHGFIIFSDEVYRFLELDVNDRLPALCEIDDHGVSLGVMSKSFGLAGLRIGWIATRNSELLEKLATFKDYTTICNSAPSEYLATMALRNKGRILDRNLELIRSNLQLLGDFFGNHQERFSWRAPLAGPIAFPKLLRGSVDAFCASVVEKSGVLLLPGSLYGENYDHFRIGYGRKNLPEALDHFAKYLGTI